MLEHYAESSVTVGEIAQKCFVSEVYLRKLYEKECHTTPFKALTDIRMKHAYMLAKEKCPIKEIARAVGYSDVYQFSRAYKRHFGYPPAET